MPKRQPYSNRITQRTVLERFLELEFSAMTYAANKDSHSRTIDLHDAALRYAAAVRRVARRSRDA